MASPARRRAAAGLLITAAGLLAPTTGAAAATTVSSNWAGYVATPKSSSTKFKKVSGTWVVPRGDCGSGSGYSATWVGIGGYRSSSKALEQTGTEFDCTASGVAKYFAWYELVPDVGHDIEMSVRPGDTIDAAVSVNGSRVTVYLRNRTRGAVFRKTFVMARPDRSSAEWIVEAPSSCESSGNRCIQLPISNFGTVGFSRTAVTTARGTQGGISDPHWSNTEVTLSQGGGRFARFASTRGANPSPLSGDGASFAVAYTEEAPPTATEPPVLFPSAGETQV